jgi:hypothetical protein
MKLSRVLTLLIVLSFVGINLYAQSDTKPVKKPFKERLVFGGGATLNFSNIQTAVGISPMVGYRVTDRYIAGIGLSYLYLSGRDYKANNYAASIFNRFSVTEELFLHAEMEYGTSQVTLESLLGDQKYSVEYPAFLVGGGYRQSGGSGIGLSITVLYDVLQDRNSPYQQGLVYRGGVFFGF